MTTQIETITPPASAARKAAAVTAAVNAIEGEPGGYVRAAERRHLEALYDQGARDAMALTPDQLDDLELALARARAQLGRPRLLWAIPEVRGHRPGETGDRIGFTGQVRQYDDGGPAVIVTRGGDRFPLDDTVEVYTP